MKTLFAITLLLTTALICSASLEVEKEMISLKDGWKLELKENRADTIVKLGEMIRNGSSVEKDAALYAVEQEQITELIPAVIEAISDKTKAPRYGDTGWGYIGRHAGSIIKGLMSKLDREWLKSAFKSSGQQMDFFNQENREDLKSFCSNWWISYNQRKDLTRQ